MSHSGNWALSLNNGTSKVFFEGCQIFLISGGSLEQSPALFVGLIDPGTARGDTASRGAGITPTPAALV